MAALSMREYVESWMVDFFDAVNADGKNAFWVLILVFAIMSAVAASTVARAFRITRPD